MGKQLEANLSYLHHLYCHCDLVKLLLPVHDIPSSANCQHESPNLISPCPILSQFYQALSVL